MDISRQQLKRYAEALQMWHSRRFNTAEIAHHLDVPEGIVCRWIAAYRDLMRA